MSGCYNPHCNIYRPSKAGRLHATPIQPIQRAKCWWLLKIATNAWAGAFGGRSVCQFSSPWRLLESHVSLSSLVKGFTVSGWSYILEEPKRCSIFSKYQHFAVCTGDACPLPRYAIGGIDDRWSKALRTGRKGCSSSKKCWFNTYFKPSHAQPWFNIYSLHVSAPLCNAHYFHIMLTKNHTLGQYTNHTHFSWPHLPHPAWPDHSKCPRYGPEMVSY
jgi:hypothetical protein